MRAPVGFAIALFFPGVVASAACSLDDSMIEQEGNPGGSSVDGSTVDGTTPQGDAIASDVNVESDGKPVDAGSDVSLADSSMPSSTLVYANTDSDLFSFDTATSTLKHVTAISGGSCGNNVSDIAITSAGQLYIFEASSALYALALDGSCSGREVLSADGSDNLKIAARNAGAPSVVMIDTTAKDYFSIDPSSGAVVKITNNLFTANPKYDFACSASGTCWLALDNSKCGALNTQSCLFSFSADGSGTPSTAVTIAAQPIGLAYVNGFLYGFQSDGSIVKITPGATPTVSPIAVNLASGTTAPTTWSGAASSPAYP
jgi:hypothetical protein